MFARNLNLSRTGRATAVATATAVVLTAIAPSFAYAGPPRASGVTATSGATDFSARRRLGPGAAAAAFAGIVGTGIAIAAAQNRRAYYDDYYGGYGYGGPVYVVPAPGPYYYGYDPAYGPNGYGADTPYVNGHPLAGW